MAPGEWFTTPMNAPFAALLFWTMVFGSVYFAATQIRARVRMA
jgi:hypothetical protein